jgi:hypothetical protein
LVDDWLCGRSQPHGGDRWATDYITRWNGFSWAGDFYGYDLRDDCDNSNDRECRFGVYRRNSTAKPAASALQSGW